MLNSWRITKEYAQEWVEEGAEEEAQAGLGWGGQRKGGNEIALERFLRGEPLEKLRNRFPRSATQFENLPKRQTRTATTAATTTMGKDISHKQIIKIQFYI